MKRNLSQFDYRIVARYDTGMWRAYYQHRFFTLFRLLLKLFRNQFAPNRFVALRLAYYAAVAAADYRIHIGHENHQRVMKYLIKFYRTISAHCTRPFNYIEAAKMELEWWDIRRYPHNYNSTLELSLAKNMAAVYAIDADKLTAYAHYRAEAMLLRDRQGNTGSAEPDWHKIETLLVHSWKSLAEVVRTES
jgi:hypothetical protein